MGVIYSIMNPNGKLYVGKTYDLRKRINCHKCASKKGSKIILHNSIKKYGWGNHLLKVIEEVPDELLNEREIFWIKELKTYCYDNKNGMNMTKGADGQRSTWMHDIERRKKASEMFSGDKNPFYGKHLSDSAKKTLSEKTTKRHLERGTRIPAWGVDKMIENCSKKVLAYNLNGDFIGEYKSNSEAARKLKLRTQEVSCVVRGEQKYSNSYIFREFKENYPLKIDVSEVEFKRMSAPILLLNHDLQVMRVYSCAKEAELELNSPASNIGRRAFMFNGKPRKSGYTFVYQDVYEKTSKQLN